MAQDSHSLTTLKARDLSDDSFFFETPKHQRVWMVVDQESPSGDGWHKKINF
jgi:hypothetical protein